MNWHDLLLSTVAMGSEFLGTISGFGSSTFFMPIGVLVEKYNFVLALTAALHIFGNISKLYLFRKSFNFSMFLKFALPSAILAGVGALLNHFISFEKLKLFLGLFIMILAIVFFFKNKIISALTSRNAVFTVGLSGFLTGLLGTGGALRGIALASIQLEKSAFVALSSGIDIGGDLLRMSVYFYNDYFEWSHWFYIPLLMLAGYSGSYLGKIVINKIDQKQFEKIVMAFVFLSGALLLIE